jgi:hypothetical protein
VTIKWCVVCGCCGSGMLVRGSGFRVARPAATAAGLHSCADGVVRADRWSHDRRVPLNHERLTTSSCESER